MYAIFIRGRREPITCDDQFGRQLKDQWERGSDKLINIDEITFPAKSIYRIEGGWISDTSGREKEIDENMEYYRKEQLKFDTYRAKRLSLSVEERAKDLRIAELAYFAIVGSGRIPEKDKPEVIKKQLAYLKENPDEMYANPVCFKDIWRVQEKEGRQNAAPSMAELTRINALNFIERVLSK